MPACCAASASSCTPASPRCWRSGSRRRRRPQPELLARHFAEAGLGPQAIAYLQKAGERAAERSAYAEAIGHLNRGLELLQALPDGPERTLQELDLRLALGAALMATRGYAGPEVEETYLRARELCDRSGETPRLFPVLHGLYRFHHVRGELQAAREAGEHLLRLAQSLGDPALFVEAHRALGVPLFWLGEVTAALEQLEQGSGRLRRGPATAPRLRVRDRPRRGLPVLLRPWPCGSSGDPGRPWTGATRRSAWPATCPTRRAWPSPWCGGPGCGSSAASRGRRGSTPRRRSRSAPSRASRSGCPWP